jgi:hypothetical protein
VRSHVRHAHHSCTPCHVAQQQNHSQPVHTHAGLSAAAPRMAAFGGPRSQARPPEKGVFPLDHFAECKKVSTDWRAMRTALPQIACAKLQLALHTRCSWLMRTSSASAALTATLDRAWNYPGSTWSAGWSGACVAQCGAVQAEMQPHPCKGILPCSRFVQEPHGQAGFSRARPSIESSAIHSHWQRQDATRTSNYTHGQHW